MPFVLPFICEADQDETALVDQRRKLHKAFVLEDRPLLRNYLSRELCSAQLSSFEGKIGTIHLRCLGKKRMLLYKK